MSIHDDQEINRLRAQADKLREEISALCGQLNGGNGVIARQNWLLNEALWLLDQACCARGDKLTGEIWRNRLNKLKARASYQGVAL
jgi:hypothetical protein